MNQPFAPSPLTLSQLPLWLKLVITVGIICGGALVLLAIGLFFDTQKTRHLFHFMTSDDCGRCRERAQVKWRALLNKRKAVRRG